MSETCLLKRCLVTGASGFLGKVLCEQLQNNGIIVRALLRQNQAGPWSETVLCDLNDFDNYAIELFSGIDTIFYLASIAHDKAPVDMYDAFNVKLCLSFAQMALQQGVKRFIYVSSTKAMAEPNEKVVDETFFDWPKDLYGLSKRHAEEGLLSLAGFDHLVIVRPCLIYGKGVQGNLYSMLKFIDRGIFPPLPETGKKRSMVSVRDVASALRLCASTSVAHRKTYLLTDSVDYSVKVIENSMRLALHKKPLRWFIPNSVLTVMGYFPFLSQTLQKLLGSARYSSEKIQRELGWYPSENLFQVLPEMVHDLRSHKKLK